MDNIDKIGKIEALALLITVINNAIIINLPSAILNTSGTGSWINIIVTTILLLFFTLLICKFFKLFISCDILDVSEFLGKKILKIIVGVLYIFLFLFVSAMYLRYFSNTLQILYYNDTPLVFLIILLLIPIVITSKYGLKSISGTNLVFVPIAIIAIITLFITSSKDFVWQRIFPILGHGITETFVPQFSNLSIFNVVAYFFFIKPFLKSEDNFKKISIISVLLCGLFLTVSVLSLLMTFSFIAQTDENLSLHLLTRLVRFGKFLQRIDAIFVFIWILSSLSFLSLNLYLVANIFKKICNLKSTGELVYPFSGFFLASCMMFKNIASVESTFQNFYCIYYSVLIFLISFLVLLFGYIKKKTKES